MSEKGAIKKSTAQAICDAVKVKEGTTEGVPFKDVAERILALPSASGGENNKLAKIIDGTVRELTEDDFKNVTIIRPHAFAFCKSLQRVVIPEGVTKILNSAFYQTTQMSVTIPVSVKTIESYAFDLGTTGGTFIYKGTIADWCDIDIDSRAYTAVNRKLYVTNALGNRELLEKSIVIDMVTEIKKYAFSSYGYITTLAIGGKVQTIGFRAFDKCHGLIDLEIGDSVINIDNYAFEGSNKLTTVAIGSGVTNIGTSVFSSCSALTDIYIDKPENSVSGAPWGASNATIHWNTPLPSEEV